MRPIRPDRDPPADVAIVLGAAVLAGGEPSASLVRRVRHAARLWCDGAVRDLLLTGGIVRYPPSEAEVMRRLAERDGVDPAHIVLEERATTTLESAVYCPPIVAAHGWRSIVLVTDAYHLPRSLMAFRRHGVFAQGSAPTGGRGGTARWRWAAMHVREAAALSWYVVRMRRRRG